MKDWILQRGLELLVGQVTKENIQRAADVVKKWFIPKVRNWKEDQIAKLQEEAKKSNTTLDDTLVQAFDQFIEALLPDNPTVL
jgi:hypothetical protein